MPKPNPLTVELVHQPETFGSGCWMVDIVHSDHEIGSVGCGHFSSRAHAGAFRKGALAAMRGDTFNPYSRVGRRGFSNAWRAGHDAALAAMRDYPHA